MANPKERPVFSASERRFYANAKARAKQLRVSQRTIADTLRLSEAFVSEFLNLKNRLSSNRFDDLAAVLQTSVATLFTEFISPDSAKEDGNVPDMTLPDTGATVELSHPDHQGASVYVREGSTSADSPLSRDSLRRTYDEIDATIDTLITARLRLAGLLGRADDQEQPGRTAPPQTRVGWAAERGTRPHVVGRAKPQTRRRA